MTTSLIALTGFAAWSLALVLALVLMRTVIVTRGEKKANEFSASGDDVSGVVQRLTRAHANCYENLPLFASLIAAAGLSGQFAVSDPWAMWILYARIAQSLVHVLSTSPMAVTIRFVFFLVQLALMGWIAIQLLF